VSAGERRAFLLERLSALNDEIRSSERETEVDELARRVADGEPLTPPPSDDDWHLLLPNERAARLPAYYLALRAELAVLNREGAKARRSGRLREFLDGPVPKLTTFGLAAIKISELVVAHGGHALQALGLGFDAAGGEFDDEVL
jgi:hypothetical protein